MNFKEQLNAINLAREANEKSKNDIREKEAPIIAIDYAEQIHNKIKQQLEHNVTNGYFMQKGKWGAKYVSTSIDIWPGEAIPIQIFEYKKSLFGNGSNVYTTEGKIFMEHLRNLCDGDGIEVYLKTEGCGDHSYEFHAKIKL